MKWEARALISWNFQPGKETAVHQGACVFGGEGGKAHAAGVEGGLPGDGEDNWEE